MAGRQWKSIDERIEEARLKLKKLEEKRKQNGKPTSIKMDRDSAGVKDAISALNHVVTANNTSMGEVLKLISRLRRTGLRIEDPVKKPRKKKIDQAAMSQIN